MEKRRICGIEQAYNQGAVDLEKIRFLVIYTQYALKILPSLPLSIMTNGKSAMMPVR